MPKVYFFETDEEFGSFEALTDRQAIDAAIRMYPDLKSLSRDTSSGLKQIL